MKKFLKKKYFVILLVLIVAVGGFFIYNNSKTTSANTKDNFTEVKVARGNIETVISGSGPVASSNSKKIFAKVQGTVSGVYFDEGDVVKQGDLLAEIDQTDINIEINQLKREIEEKEKSLQEAKEDVINLNITSSIIGQVSNIKINEGDNVNEGSEIATITDVTQLELVVSFSENQISKFSVGDSAKVYLQDYMDIVDGTVTYINNFPNIISGGGKVYDVEISMNNPGTVLSGTVASASVNNQMSIDSNLIEYKDEVKIRSKVNGTVKEILVRNNQKINKNDILVVLENDSLDSTVYNVETQLYNLKLDLDEKLEKQSDHKIYATQDGTVVSKDIEIDEETSVNDVVATISNQNALEFIVEVDELDIAKISEGLKAKITIDALPDQTFTGIITGVGLVGISESGVTTYPVTISIDNPKNIRETMNANADIIVEQKDDVLLVPITAIQKVGQKNFVYVKSNGQKPQDNQVSKNNSENDKITENRTRSNKREDSQNIRDNQENGQIAEKTQRRKSSSISTIKFEDENVQLKPVIVGINDGNYIEIVKGLNEGETIFIPSQGQSASNKSPNMMMMGGMMGGGMNRPQGGAQGGKR